MRTSDTIPKETDWTFLTKIMENNDFTSSTPWEVIRFVYEATWTKYQQKFMQEKLYNHKLESKIVEKNKEIDRLQLKQAELEQVIEDAGIEIQSNSNETTKADS